MALYDQEWAEQYDSRARAGLPGYEAIHIVCDSLLAPLPENSSILVVGAGTGTELLLLGKRHPEWRFVAVEPAPAMLNACRARVESIGLTQRVSFHAGTLETLPDESPQFDAATAILVLHHLVSEAEREAFLKGLANRLKPGGRFFSTDMFGSLESEEFQVRLGAWKAQAIAAGIPESEILGLIERNG